MTQVGHEARVRRFYDDDGDAAGRTYVERMGDCWFHGDAATLRAGQSAESAAEAMLRRLIDSPQISRGSRVLEFGSGVGGAAVRTAVMTGATVVGVSNSESLNIRARQLADEQDVRQVSFLTIGDDDYKTLAAWPDEIFDAVLFMESVCHLPDKQAFFTAAHRITVPGGWIAGLDWLQRPFGSRRTPQECAELIDPVCEHFRLARPLGTLDSYTQMMTAAGYQVTHCADEYAGELCLGNTDPQEIWQPYESDGRDLHMQGKRALDAARHAGVFTVGTWAGYRP